MINIFERKQIADGIWFNRITDKRYKVSAINVGFYTDFDELTNADYAIVPYLLVDCCEKYPDYKSLSIRFSELYGASISDTHHTSGDKRYIGFSVNTLNDRYALEGERLEQESCELLIECLMRPLAKNGAFDAELVRLMKSELIDSIDSVINDKRTLAANHGAKIAYEGEPMGTPAQGTHEQAEQITPENAYKAYRRMLEHGHIEIFATGNSSFDDAERLLTEAFAAIPRSNICKISATPSALKPSPRFATEEMEMQQAITRMYFKAPQMSDRYANAVFGMILGGMTTSRFFENIREKQSLCYYCSCFTNRFTKTLTCYAGIEPQNAGQVRQAIQNEFEDICRNGITEEELERAKCEILNDTSSLYDSVSGIAGWYLGQVLENEFISPEEYAERIKAVTAQRVQAAAKLYTLDTCYTLSPKEVRA